MAEGKENPSLNCRYRRICHYRRNTKNTDKVSLLIVIVLHDKNSDFCVVPEPEVELILDQGMYLRALVRQNNKMVFRRFV